RGGISIEQVYGDVSAIKNNYEPHLKDALRRILELQLITTESNADLLQSIETFLQRDYVYFANDKFMNEELEHLVQIGVKVSDELSEVRFRRYKRLLEEQLR